MDGVDDYIQTPIITFKEIALDVEVKLEGSPWKYITDARDGTGAYLFVNSSRAVSFSQSSVFVDDIPISKDQVDGIPSEERITIRHILTEQASADVTIFSRFSLMQYMSGKIYDIQFLDDSSNVVAHFDMSTKTVNDLTGNGNHATLHGGTWVEGGIDVSTRFDSLQTIYSDSAVGLDTKQDLYLNELTSYDIKNVVYEDKSISHDLFQKIYKENKNQFDTKQAFLKPIISIVHLQGKRDLTVHLKGGVEVTAENQNFKMYTGDTKYIYLSVEDGTLDLNGVTVKWILKNGVKNAPEITIFKTNGQGVTIDLNANMILIKLDPSDSIDLLGKYYHEAELTDALGNISTIMVGEIEFKKSCI